jgi:class 3 adenylate cyclase/tetratricopeptide (TPR) repeat protein
MPRSHYFFRHMSLITMMFTDVVESTATKRDISFGRDNRERDHAYLTQVQTPHFELIRGCYQAHHGREVSTIGDAFFLAFDDPAEAVRCAVLIQKKLNESPIETPLGPLRVRIGIHSGFPEFFESSWHGTDVDTAARVEGAAEARQIVVSTRTYELTRDMTDAKFYPLGEFKLKGVGQVALWEVDWQGQGPSPPRAPAPESVQRQNRMNIAIAGALVAALLAGSAVVYRYKITHRPAVPQTFKVPAEDRRSIAIFPFENLGKPEVGWLSTALPELLNTELTAASGELRAINGEDVATTKLDLDLKDTSSYSSATLSKVRKILHTDYVVAGAYLAAGNLPTDSVTLDLNLQDAATGRTLGTSKQEGTVGSYNDLLKRAGAGLRNSLGVNQPPQAQLDAAKAGLPTNPEALRYYAEGLAKLRTFDALESRDLLDRSLRIEPNLAVAHAALANAWQMSGYDSKALEEAKKAIENYGKLSPIEQSAIDGRYHELASQWEQAIETYRSLSNIVKDEPNYPLELASVQTAAGKGNDALATLAALRKWPNMGQDPRVDLGEAFAAQSLSDVKQQQAAAARAAQGAVRQGSRVLAAQAYWLECSALVDQGDLKKAEAACNESVKSAPFDLQSMARAQTVLSNIMVAQGNTSAALAMRKEILDNARKIGSQKDIIGALDHLANLLDLLGNTDKTREYFDEAFDVAHKIDDKQQLLQLDNDYAADLYGDGDFKGAEDLYGKSLAIARGIGDQQGTAMALQNLSLVLVQKGDLPSAQAQIEQAIAIQRKAGLKTDLASSLQSLADLQLVRGDLVGARKNYEEYMKLSKELNSPARIASGNLSMAGLAFAEGKPSEAEALANQAADIFQRENLVDDEADARNVLARGLLAEGKISDAQAQINRASTLSPQDRTVRLALAITGARLKARSGNNGDARKDLEACRVDAIKMKLIETVLDVKLAEAEVLAASDPKAALEQLQSVQREANAKGYLIVAAEAERTRQRLARHKTPQPG